MSTIVYDCTIESQRAEGLQHAQKAIAQKQTVVMPTDTVYGIAADAFSPVAVATLLAAKGRGRSMPPPVLIQRIQTMDGLATDISEDARKLADAFWPGGLTLIFHAQPSLDWDLGETFGTVALRMPDDALALDLLTLTGPLAVSSANRTGQPTPSTAAGAREQLGEVVEVYLGDGERPKVATGAESSAEEAEAQSLSSTIVDATGEQLRVVRRGAITLEQLRAIVPSVLDIGEEPAAEPITEDTADTVDSVDSSVEQSADPGESVESVESADSTEPADSDISQESVDREKSLNELEEAISAAEKLQAGVETPSEAAVKQVTQSDNKPTQSESA
ncbi:L-threonylcarbamoyladenylate synthase [Psychromicrobium lacuslunae]|uniref:L-threonylcarbamoyladenylate synthase n=1 Tax=Psychromicrobium lacuslunae TaxID=1618207 RepID=UPI0009E3A732|nr:L-threonylcarbamoyladenylate synthase [Psychromicrobium lacuslunae]